MRIDIVATLSVCLCIASSSVAQIPAAKSARSIPTEVELSESRISRVIAKAEDHFRKGKRHLQLNQREKARDEFDLAVDCILESGLDVRGNQRLQTFYLELVERIYREEAPITVTANSKRQVGFRDQEFRPSPADDLSKRVSKSEAESPRGSSNSNSLAQLRSEYISSTRDYKVSLKKLLAIYESNLQQAEANLTVVRQYYSDGLLLRSQLDEASRAVNLEREKVASTQRLIQNADNDITKILIEAGSTKKSESSPGPMPSQLAKGQVPVVMQYLNDNLNDPYSMKLLKWSKLRIVYKYDQPYWYVTLRMSAKNGFGAYVLREAGFYVKNNRVVFTDNL